MISKKIPRKNPETSSICRLVNYIANDQNKASRLVATWTRNCVNADDLWAASKEMEIVQRQNRRAQTDKTYHLLISFRESEIDIETLRAIEARYCEALGYGEHQRAAAAHHDTDNLHLHIAINKINPQTLKICDPIRDYKIRDNLTTQLEREFGLEPDNHESQRPAADQKIVAAEKFSGEKMLATILQEHREPFSAARTWSEFHAICASLGAEIKPRGNGMVFVAENARGKEIAVKASTVSREFSRAKLAQKFGAFVETEHAKEKNLTPAMPGENKKTPPLFAAFLKRRETQAEIYARQQAQLEIINEEFSRRAEEITQRGMPNRELQRLRREISARKKAARKKFPAVGFLAWLQTEAANGNADALLYLRQRAVKTAAKANAVASGRGGENSEKSAVDNLPIDTVTKRGTIIFRVGKEFIRDRGRDFTASSQISATTALMLLKIASARFGDQLKITGSETFKRKMLAAAVDENLPITFRDPELEKRRQEMLAQKQAARELEKIARGKIAAEEKAARETIEREARERAERERQARDESEKTNAPKPPRDDGNSHGGMSR